MNTHLSNARSLPLFAKYSLPIIEMTPSNIDKILAIANNILPGNPRTHYHSTISRASLVAVFKFNGLSHNEILKIFNIKSRRHVTYYLDYFFFLHHFNKMYKDIFNDFIEALKEAFPQNFEHSISA